MAQWICSTDLSELYEARRICKNANVQDYGSRDSVYAYITREDLVRIPVAIFFFFFCPLDHLRRGKPNSGVWRRMSTLVPYERRARPAKYHDVGARSPRGHEVHAARCCRAIGGASTACSGLLAATHGQLHHQTITITSSSLSQKTQPLEKNLRAVDPADARHPSENTQRSPTTTITSARPYTRPT